MAPPSCGYCEDGKHHVIETLGKIVAATAIAGTLQNATGKQWQLRGNYFYEINPISKEYTGNKLSPAIAKMYKTLKDSGISTITPNWGNTPRVQGSDDPTEFLCRDFTLAAVNVITNSGGHAAAIGIVGRDTLTGEYIGHAIVALLDTENQRAYMIDPIGIMDTRTTKTPQQINEYFNKKLKDPMNYVPIMDIPIQYTLIQTMTLVEPQTNEIYGTGTQFAGKKIKINGRDIIIEHIEIIGDPIGIIDVLSSKNRKFITESTDRYTKDQLPGTQNTSPMPYEQLDKSTTLMARRNERIV